MDKADNTMRATTVHRQPRPLERDHLRFLKYHEGPRNVHKEGQHGRVRHRSRNLASLLRLNVTNRRAAAQPAGVRATTSSAKAVVRRAGAGTRSTAKSRGGGRDRAGSAAASFTRRFAPGAAGGETKKHCCLHSQSQGHREACDLTLPYPRLKTCDPAAVRRDNYSIPQLWYFLLGARPLGTRSPSQSKLMHP